MDENDLNELKNEEVLEKAKEHCATLSFNDLKFHSREEVFEASSYGRVDGFTSGKKYTILNEIHSQSINKSGWFPVVYYVVKDNEGNERKVPHYFFNPVYKESKSIKDLEVPMPLIRLREEHEKLAKENKLGPSGMPDIVWNLHEKLKETEGWKQLAGVKQRMTLSLVSIDKMQDKVARLLHVAEEIADELDSMKYQLLNKENK